MMLYSYTGTSILTTIIYNIFVESKLDIKVSFLFGALAHMHFFCLLQHSKSEMFNNFLKEMKSEFIGMRYSAFWGKVVGESISLVTSSESGNSSVTDQDAKQVHVPLC